MNETRISIIRAVDFQGQFSPSFEIMRNVFASWLADCFAFRHLRDRLCGFNRAKHASLWPVIPTPEIIP